MTAVFWTSAPYPPSPTLRDQHTVVHGHHTPCVCTRYGAYAVRVGVEPSSAALALPAGISPPEGCAHLSLRQLPSHPIPTMSSTNPLPVYACRAPDTPWQDHLPSAVSPQRSRY